MKRKTVIVLSSTTSTSVSDFCDNCEQKFDSAGIHSTYALETFLEVLVDEKRDELWRFLVEVDERLKSLRHVSYTTETDDRYTLLV